LKIREETFGKYHLDTAVSYKNIGDIYSIQRNYEEAVNYYNIAVNIREDKLGKSHPDTTALKNNIQIENAKQGKLDKPSSIYSRGETSGGLLKEDLVECLLW